MIDVLNNKQDKLIAGDGITIANDGKTISSSTPGMTFISDSIRNHYTVENGVLTVPKNLLFIGTSSSGKNDIVLSVLIYAGKYSTNNSRFSSFGGHLSTVHTYPIVGLTVNLASNYVWVHFEQFKSATDNDFIELTRLNVDTTLSGSKYKVYTF